MIVVGAGLAGLQAARSVVAAGHSVVVVEARDRVGGRTLNADVGGGKVVEVGGQWVGPTQDRLLALGQGAGRRHLQDLLRRPGRPQLPGVPADLRRDGPARPDPARGRRHRRRRDRDRQARRHGEVDRRADARGRRRSAGEYDGQTFETWKLANTTDDRRALPGRPRLHVGLRRRAARRLAAVRRSSTWRRPATSTTPGSFTRLIGTDGGAQDSRFVGGSQPSPSSWPRRSAGASSSSRRCGSIAQSGGGVTVTTDKRRVQGQARDRRHPARRSPARIRYAPGMPFLRDQLTQRLPMGTVIKTCVVYDKPFWRDQGLAGLREHGLRRRPPHLRQLAAGRHARDPARLHRGRRRARVGPRPLAERPPQAGPVRADASSTATRPPSRSEYLERSGRRRPTAAGATAATPRPALLLGYGEALRAPVGRIHWAGTETADVLERLHGRRPALRRARGEGSARRPLRAGRDTGMIVTVLGTGTMGAPMVRNLVGAPASTSARGTARRRRRATSARRLRGRRRGGRGRRRRHHHARRRRRGGGGPRRGRAAARRAVWAQMSTVGVDGGRAAGRPRPAARPRRRARDRHQARRPRTASSSSSPPAPTTRCERCAPVFDAVGKQTVRLGEAGRATA